MRNIEVWGFGVTYIRDLIVKFSSINIPDSKVHMANMGPTWVLSAPGGPHVGPMNFAIRDGKSDAETL